MRAGSLQSRTMWAGRGSEHGPSSPFVLLKERKRTFTRIINWPSLESSGTLPVTSQEYLHGRISRNPRFLLRGAEHWVFKILPSWNFIWRSLAVGFEHVSYICLILNWLDNILVQIKKLPIDSLLWDGLEKLNQFLINILPLFFFLSPWIKQNKISFLWHLRDFKTNVLNESPGDSRTRVDWLSETYLSVWPFFLRSISWD